MANHAGLKKVIKTVHTKKGTKRQIFWVKSAPKEPAKKSAASAPKSGGKITGKHVAGAAAAFGALAAGAYALHKMHKAKKAGVAHMGKTLQSSIAAGRAPKYVTPSGKSSSYDEFMRQPGVVRVGSTSHEEFMRQPGVTRVR